MIAAGAEWAVGIDLHMTELAGHAVIAAEKLAVGKDSGADSLRDVDDNEIVHAVAVAEPDFGERTGVGYVVHLDAKARGPLNARFDAEHRPVEIGGEDEFLQMQISTPGEADSDAIEGLFFVRGDKLANAGNDSSEGLASIGWEDDDVLRYDFSAEISDSDGGLRRMNVERNDGAMIVELNERGAAATWKTACSSLQYPTVCDEFFNNKRDRAALKAGKARKVCPRDGRARADEIKEQIPVDVPGSFVGSGLFAGKDKTLHR